MWVSENMDKYYFKVGGGDLRFNAHMFAEALLIWIDSELLNFARAILRKAQQNECN